MMTLAAATRHTNHDDQSWPSSQIRPTRLRSQAQTGEKSFELSLLRSGLAMLAEQQELGIILAQTDGQVLWVSPIAEQLCGGALLRLPQVLADRAQAGETLQLAGSVHSVAVSRTALPQAGYELYTLRETKPRATLAERLRKQLGLSTRSIQLALLASEGLRYRDIAQRLNLSESTVKTYMHSLFREIDVKSRAELCARIERINRQ